MSWFSRLRHGKGFGVHSPFAFRFITEVLRERLRYYDFDVIKDRRMRLIYRMVCYFRPRTVAASEATAKVALMVCPSAVAALPAEAELVIYDTPPEPAEVTELLDTDRVIIVCGPHKDIAAEVDKALTAADHGMTFDNERSMLVIVNNHKLPHQNFPTRF